MTTGLIKHGKMKPSSLFLPIEKETKNGQREIDKKSCHRCGAGGRCGSGGCLVLDQYHYLHGREQSRDLRRGHADDALERQPEYFWRLAHFGRTDHRERA